MKSNQVLQSFISIFSLLLTVVYGLILRPLMFEQSAFSLEVIFLFSAVFVVIQLMFLGYSWDQIQDSLTKRLTQALPTVLLLFAIGILIGTWMISGTIPLLIYIGLKLITAEHIYFYAFVIPILFSMCTGTSWGAIATIGLVIISVSTVVGADLGITAGAVIGGAYFGDKMSPLSDTTNIAAIAVKVPLTDHIKAMRTTTFPSAIISAGLFFTLDYFYPSTSSQLNTASLLNNTLRTIKTMFDINVLLLAPPLIIMVGSIFRKPPLPTLIASSFLACVLAAIIQSSSLDNIVQTVYKGFTYDMVQSQPLTSTLTPMLASLFNRGGIYALIDPIIITIMVFIYVGAIDRINALPTVIHYLLNKIKTKSMLVITTLLSSALTNALTSSQYANSFIIGEAFSNKYDEFHLPKPVLSRSLEDTGTMIESLVPWSTTSVFIFSTLGVSIIDYWQWQFLSIINISIAFIFAIFGVGFYNSRAFKSTSLISKGGVKHYDQSL
ncbi:sodium:proton antiporter [Pseudoalteromonas sp. MMG013]|uniref:Na+/H+ antiporter NhaC family protein n=1 Tax=Pseudoalteromonas sp. MMG013 TaxID=2822687 RepID=UPI001B359721|nr:Na+/H+ antiporter NhaC family protein [Pseudoalteromonas sp. MMG013]MBQ4860367.1 sodium:proton antiporter [Pseudoalteromonas sp. MMG013]